MSSTIPAASDPLPEAPQPPPPPAAPPSPRRRRSSRHVAALVAGSMIGLVGFAGVAGGGAALWANGEKHDDGFLWTSTERVASPTPALATENLDVDFDGAAPLVDSGAVGKVRLKARSRTDARIFVGIARTSDVSRFLRGTEHALVTDVDTETFRTSFTIDARTVSGTARAGDPRRQGFWVASSYGAGQRELSWKVKDGDWSVVLMNVDGSRGVDADVSAGAEAPFLAPLGWSLLGGGLVLLLVGGGLVTVGVRGGAPRSDAPAPPVA